MLKLPLIARIMIIKLISEFLPSNVGRKCRAALSPSAAFLGSLFQHEITMGGVHPLEKQSQMYDSVLRHCRSAVVSRADHATRARRGADDK